MARVEAPEIDCPKCGDERAFVMAEPTYDPSPPPFFYPGLPYGSFDRLTWPCARCGFVLRTQPADYVAQPATFVHPPSMPSRPSRWSRLRAAFYV